MSLFCFYNAKVIKLLICVLLAVGTNLITIAQEEGEDPIKEAIEEHKQEEYIGSKLNPRERNELERIYTKYQLSEREVELRSKQRSGQKISIIDKFRIARANRKDYMRAKKLEKFRKNKVMSKQSLEVRKRMKENHKRTERVYKKNKRRKKRRSFFNLFR